MGLKSESSLDLVATHLNAPVGPIVSADDLRKAFLLGTLDYVPKKSADLISFVFLEIDPPLITRCAREVGVDVNKINMLYLSILRDKLAPRSLKWEQAVEHLK